MKHITATKRDIVETDTGEELLVLGFYPDGKTRRYTCVRITDFAPSNFPSVRIGFCYVHFTDINTIDEESIHERIDTVPWSDMDIVDDAIRTYLMLQNGDSDEALIGTNTNLIEMTNDLEEKCRLLKDENNELRSHIRELSGVISPEEVEEQHISELKTEISVLNRIIDTLVDKLGKEHGKEQ